jgi:YidC/Oxa1 family membrane protein insertase
MQVLFGFISHPMEIGLAWLALTTGNAAIAIALFTLLVRLLLSPLQIAQLRNARAMQRIQPRLRELRRKHGKDQGKLLAATRDLYREHRVHPLAGFAAMAIQIPVLISLNYALAHLGLAPFGYPAAVDYARSACHGIAVHNWTGWFDACYAVSGVAGGNPHIWKLFHAHILWLRGGLAEPDPLWILPAIAGATQWVQSRMMLTRSDDPQQQMMNRAMHFLPLIVILFAAHVSAGLSLYWIASTLIAIALQSRITGWGLLPDAVRAWAGPAARRR